MTYFLDTDACIFILRGKTPSIKSWFEKLTPDQIKISAVVKAELLVGAQKSRDPQRTSPIVEMFLSPFEIVPFDDSACPIYSKIRHELERKGNSIGPHDLLIAATALSHDGILVTHNVREYRRIPDLKIQALDAMAS